MNYTDRDVNFLKTLKDKWYDYNKSIGLLNEARNRQGIQPEKPQPTKQAPTQPVTPKEPGYLSETLWKFKKWAEQLWQAVYRQTHPTQAVQQWIKPEWFLPSMAKQIWANLEWFETTMDLALEWKQSKADTFMQVIAETWDVALTPLREVFGSAISTITPESTKEQLAEVVWKVANTQVWKDMQFLFQQKMKEYEDLKVTDPAKAQNQRAYVKLLELWADLFWFGVGKKAFKKTWKELLEQPITKATLPTKPLPTAPWVPPVWPMVPTAITKPLPLVKDKKVLFEWLKKKAREMESRIQRWDVEFKGVVWEKPTIKPIKTLKPKIEKWVDITKSDDLIRRWLKPSVAWKTTEYAYQKVNKDLREGIGYVSKSKWVASDWVDAMRKTADRKKEIYKTIENNNELVTIKTNIDDIEVKLNKFLNSEEWKAFSSAHPWMRQKVASIVDNWRGEYWNTMTQKQMQLLKQEFNKTLAKWDFAKMLQTPTIKSLADAKISQTLWNLLDDNVMKVLWNTNKALNKEYWAVRNLEKTLARRMGVFSRNTKWGLTGLTDIFNLWDVVMWTLTGDIKQAWKWLVGKWISSFMKRAENPNRIIKELFKLHWTKKPTIWQKLQKITWKKDIDITLKPKPLIKWLLPKKAWKGKQKKPIKLRESVEKSRPKTTKSKPSKPLSVNKEWAKKEKVRLEEIKNTLTISKTKSDTKPKISDRWDIKVKASKAIDNKELSPDLEFMLKQNRFDVQQEIPELVKKYWEIELWLIRAYTESNFKKLNDSLRKLSISDTNKQFWELLKQTLDSLPNFKWKTYRATWLKDEIFNKLKKGEILFDKWFSSTSADIWKAKEFFPFKSSSIAWHKWRKHILFEIEWKTGKDIDKMSYIPWEKEVLFKPDTKFKIKDIIKEDFWPVHKQLRDDNIWYRIIMEEV